MTFFYDLNKRLAQLASKQDAKQITEEAKAVAPKSQLAQALNERDLGKHNNAATGFAALAKKTGSGEKGNRIAGAQLAKMRAKGQVEESDMDESAFQAAIGKKKYGSQGMKALQKAGRDGASEKTMSNIRNKYDKYDESQGMTDEGNAFGNAVRKAKADGVQKGETVRVGSKIYPVKEADIVGLGEKKAKPDYIDLDKDGDKKEPMKKAAADKKKSRSAGTAFDPEVAQSMFANKDKHPRHDVQDTGYSKRYTRKAEPETEKDDAEVSDAPKRRGRPKGADKGPERTTKGAWKHKGDRKVKEDGMPMTDRGEYDREGDMAKEQMHTIVSAAKELHSILRDEENLPEWVQKKITLAKEYIDTARDYMLSQHAERAEEQPIAEKAVSKKQQKFMGMVHAAQKGEQPASGAVAKVAKSMGKKDAKDFAATKHKGLPEKVKKKDESVEETTVAGSVATAPVAAKKSSGGMQFGKGVYEGFDAKVESIITEGMSVNISIDEQGKKSINVNATEQDAEALADLLKMAGLGVADREGSCPTCSQAPCGCAEMVDENSPDYPTNTETSNDALQYSGGLNGPKSTGQTTVPVVASQLRRQVSMEESAELERSLFKTWKNYKG
jgi:hypothetical protein